MYNLPLDIKKWRNKIPLWIEGLYQKTYSPVKTSPLEGYLSRLLETNFTLWQYEDEARRKDAPDKTIANLKRNIDKKNQKRHDLMNTIDALLQKDIEEKLKTIDESLSINSETPGSIFDRLIVLSLREYHLKNETERKGVDKCHIERCSQMLKEVKSRSEDMLKCIEDLLGDYYSGRKRLKSYKEHKLYNDPSLNPSLRKNSFT